MFRLWFVCAVSVLFACGDDPAGNAANGPAFDATRPSDAKASAPEPAVVTYPDTHEGLKQLFSDLRAALADAADEPKAAAILYSLQLPAPKKWFEETFGEPTATRLVADYETQRADIGSLAQVLRTQDKRGLTQVDVSRYVSAKDESAVVYQRKAIAKMRVPNSLFSVRLSNPERTQVFHIWSFIHDGSTFRFVGKLKRAATSKKTTKQPDFKEYTEAAADRLKALPDAGPP